MNLFYNMFPREVTEAIGWTLFHSVWQGIAIALLLSVLLLLAGKFSAHMRYIVAFASLVLFLLCTSVTFIKSYKYASERMQLREQIISNPRMVVDHFRESLKKSESKSPTPAYNARLKIKLILFKSYLQKRFPVIITIWLTGMIFLLFRFIGGLIVVKRMKNHRTLAIEEKWNHLTSVFAAKLNIKKKILLLQSYALKVPVTLGYVKPVILLPVSLFTGLTTSEIESIIAHELAHIARRDYLFNIIQSLIEILFFYHPAIWWISSVAKTERENSCDDIAIELTGDKLIYARALANMQEQVVRESSIAMAFGNNKNKLFKRVKRLLNHNPMKTNLKEGFIVSCILFAGILVISLFAGASANQLGNSRTSFKDTIPSSAYAKADSSENNRELESLRSTAESEKKLNKEKKEFLDDIENVNISDDVQKELEVALAYLDDDISYEVLKGVKGALNNMDINLIVHEAMKGANAAIKNVDINTIVHESLKECNNSGSADINQISREAIKGATAALNEMDLNNIINEALKGAEGAIKEVNLNKIINKSLKEEFKSENRSESEDKYYSIIKDGSENWNNWRKENPKVLPDLSDRHLQGLGLKQVNLSGAVLVDAVIEGADLRKADFSNCKGDDIKIKGSEIKGAVFENANLEDARFSGNIIEDANFNSCNLEDAEFSGNSIINCDFRKANIRGVNFSGSSLEKCNFKEAVADEETIFPYGFDLRKHGIIMK